MADLENFQKQFQTIRQSSTEADRAYQTSRANLKNVEEKLRQLERVFDSQNGQMVEQRQFLESERKRLQATIKEIGGSREGFLEELAGLKVGLQELGDPTRLIQSLNDAYPILLFPLRVETRFKTIASDNVSRNELWVRIYPDDAMVTAFEPLPSRSEVDNMKIFWTELWEAGNIPEGGDDTRVRGAWRVLANAHGSGRAAWLMEHYRPLNESEKPNKADPNDVILVIRTQEELTQDFKDDVTTFWEAYWKADGNSVAQNTAWEALRLEVGDESAHDILDHYRPSNLDENPPAPFTRLEVDVSVVFIRFPVDGEGGVAASPASWTKAPEAGILPDRFVVMCFNGDDMVHISTGAPVPDTLAVGPDPSLPEEEQIRIVDGNLVVNDELLWLVDFERAVQNGMGVKIPLTVDQASRGFDRLFVIGVRYSSDPEESRLLVEDLIQTHFFSKRGFSLLPQGTPTNNTEESSAGATRWGDDPDETYEYFFKGAAAFQERSDPLEIRDGQWLAEYLGIDSGILKRIPNANGKEQAEARAMNIALWPATLGYYLEEMMRPVVNGEDQNSTRFFFTQFVHGRGPLPAIRIGMQPYGILPATAFSRLDFSFGRFGGLANRLAAVVNPSNYLTRLYALLKKIEADWSPLAAGTAFVGKTGDAHQLLLDIVGLHANSVEFHQRYAESFQALYNRLTLQFGNLIGTILANYFQSRAQGLLQSLGYQGEPNIKMLEKFFLSANHALKGPLIDDVPLSETAPVRIYSTDNKNYLDWLATSSLEKIRMQDFGGNLAPNALLYIMLRHGMQLAFWDAGMRLYTSRALLERSAFYEPEFLHVQAEAGGKSKLEALYRPEPEITGDPQLTIADYLSRSDLIRDLAEVQDLRQVQRALRVLQNASTASLERAFVEHLDTLSYRLDAWKEALITFRLQLQRGMFPRRSAEGDEETLPAQRGLYLGAYAWLEEVRPENKQLSVVQLSEPLREIFAPNGEIIVSDPTNAGYIHAPSLDQATTAAILKNAYISNADAGNASPFSVNINSERVRQANSILEGVRNGQTLAALLGYQFERGLHDAHNLAEVDRFIYPLRKKFPLASSHIASTQNTEADEAEIQALEARNVVDGLKLVNHIKVATQKTYPFGLPVGTGKGEVPSANPTETTAITTEAERLLAVHDGVSDLVMAEQVYQVVRGNFERASANADAFSKGAYPPEIEIAQTPRSGNAITHRVAIVFDTNVNPAVSPVASVAVTPRAAAEAPLNDWLADQLPSAENVIVQTTFQRPGDANPTPVTVTQHDLQLQPVDLLYLLNLDFEQAMSELDDRIVAFIQSAHTTAPGAEIKIAYTSPGAPGEISFFELSPLVKSLRACLVASRPLALEDLAPAAGSALTIPPPFPQVEENELRSRLQAAASALEPIRDDLIDLEADLVSSVDDYAATVSPVFLRAAMHGIPQTGTGFIYDSRHAIYNAVRKKIDALVERWQTNLTSFNTLMASYPGLGSNEEKFELLKQAERLFFPAATANPPSDPDLYKADIESRKPAFDASLAAFQALQTRNDSRLVDFLSAVEAELPKIKDHDLNNFDPQREKDDLEPEQSAATRLRLDIAAQVTALRTELQRRIDAFAAFLVQAQEGDLNTRLGVLFEAAKLVLGEDFHLMPRFSLPAAQAAELTNAWNARSSVLAYARTTLNKRFPMDEWLYGVARVRSKLAHWESASVLVEAFNPQLAFDLTPLQLPYKPGDTWLGLEFPADYSIDNDKLLLTTHFAAPFDASTPQCGILIDEWTEVIPAKQEITGLTFHFDRPNTEPPQVCLLAISPQITGSWQWSDLVDTLSETLAMAKARAIEPDMIDNTGYGHFLPATVAAVTLHMITISANYAINNNIYSRIKE